MEEVQEDEDAFERGGLGGVCGGISSCCGCGGVKTERNITDSRVRDSLAFSLSSSAAASPVLHHSLSLSDPKSDGPTTDHSTEIGYSQCSRLREYYHQIETEEEEQTGTRKIAK